MGQFSVEKSDPNGSDLSGNQQFRRMFARTVRVCVQAGIAKGEVVHVDATLNPLRESQTTGVGISRIFIDACERSSAQISVCLRLGTRSKMA
jgi:hypothetical protein